jgi:hypothetical protein
MTIPVPTQPNIEPGLSNQTHIALNLFDTILKTATTHVELEHSWAAGFSIVSFYFFSEHID